MEYSAAIDSLAPLRSQLRNIRILSRTQEYELAVRYKECGDIDAGHKLVISHMPLVMKIAMKYRSYQLPLEDLVQEGSMGLMRALETFDPYKGFRFLSFSTWWVKAYIKNFIIRTVRLVKLGTTQAQRKLFYRIGHVDQVTDGVSKEDRIRELARDLRVKEEEVRDMDARMKAREWSLDEIGGEPWLKTRLDPLESQAMGQEQLLAREQDERMAHKLLTGALKRLTDRERFIVQKRFLEESPSTLREIGAHFGISRERVRQLEVRALRKLRKKLEAWDAGDLLAA